jgi:hypothetical protein
MSVLRLYITVGQCPFQEAVSGDLLLFGGEGGGVNDIYSFDIQRTVQGDIFLQ